MGYAARVMRGLSIDFLRDGGALKRGAGFHMTRLPAEIEQVNAKELSQLSDVIERSTHSARRSADRLNTAPV
jgi:hypothetical protein